MRGKEEKERAGPVGDGSNAEWIKVCRGERVSDRAVVDCSSINRYNVLG